MAVNKEKIEKQYNQEIELFNKVTLEIKDSLNRVASIYYEKRRFKVFIPQLRIKTLTSILGKLERKSRSADSLFSETEDGLSLVANDFIGGRILCNTNEDVNEIVIIVEEYNRFEVVKKDLLDKPSGYKATHLDLNYTTFWKDKLIKVPLELQIKTFFQHAWAEVTHDDTYKPLEENTNGIPTEDYYSNMAIILEGLDGFLSTIRKQKLTYVQPPKALSDIDTIINSKTLSFKISERFKGKQLTNQEMNIALRRLKNEGYETLEDVNNLLFNEKIIKGIKEAKEELGNNENVQPFELIMYGALLEKDKIELAKDEIKTDLGFVKHKCLEEKCGKYLTEEEYEFIIQKTDSDFDFYCAKHRMDHFDKSCTKCGKFTTKNLCLECEAKESEIF